jgi:hypothetical protein
MPYIKLAKPPEGFVGGNLNIIFPSNLEVDIALSSWR